jgi:hypothetical protein
LVSFAYPDAMLPKLHELITDSLSLVCSYACSGDVCILWLPLSLVYLGWTSDSSLAVVLASVKLSWACMIPSLTWLGKWFNRYTCLCCSMRNLLCWGAGSSDPVPSNKFWDGVILVKLAPRLGLWCWTEAINTSVRCFACLCANCLCFGTCAGSVCVIEVYVLQDICPAQTYPV